MNDADGNSSKSLSTTYGFVGIGVMGYGMALNLLKKIPRESTFILCEINEERSNQFLSESGATNIQIAKSTREAAEKADIIITMLPRAQHVYDAFTNPSTGFLSASSSDFSASKFFVECSSIDTQTATSLQTLVADTNPSWSMIDAPVSGGPAGANFGTLTFMVGGSETLFNRAHPVLSMMGVPENIYHCGGPGAGLATKQLNNYLGYVGYLGLCEIMNTGLKYGLDPRILSNVINSSSGMNWNSLHHNPVKGVNPTASSAKDFKGGFTTELAGGVIDDAVALMDQVGSGETAVLAGPTKGVFDRARKDERCKGWEARSVWRLFVDEEVKRNVVNGNS